MEKGEMIEKELSWEALSQQLIKYGPEAPCFGGINAWYEAERNWLMINIKVYINQFDPIYICNNHTRLDQLGSYSDKKKTRYSNFNELALSFLKNEEFIDGFKWSFFNNDSLEMGGFYDGSESEYYTIDCLVD